MNKGLEVLEAHYLFAMPDSRIEVLIHPESVIHSLIDYADGSVLAQLGSPDMRTPIAHALAWPRRMATPVAPLDLAKLGSLSFSAPPVGRFPALELARAALRAGGSAPTVLNAANEVAVGLFLAGKAGFLAIENIVAKTLDRMPLRNVNQFDDVIEIDREARRVASEVAGSGALAGESATAAMER